MATKINDDALREMLSDISKWYDQREKINMLKVLYRYLLKDNYMLNKATRVMELMDMLTASGHINLNVLYDTINITEQRGIKDILPVFQNAEDVEISKFTHHRQKIMKLGMVLIDEDVNKISAIYNNPVKEYADTWSLIMDLEHNMVICEGKMKAFIDKLGTLNLQHAVKALKQEIPNASSNSGHSLSEEIAVKVIQKRKGESCDSEGRPYKKYALNLLNELDENKDSLTLKDMPEFFEKFENLIIYYKRCGLTLTKVGKGSIVFYLSTNDPNALMQLWEIHSSGKLIKDLANILVPVEHQQEFIDEWMTYIDENEYKAVLSKLTGKGFYSQMATSKLNQFLENVDEKVLECTICFNKLKNPKSLTCLHSFCLACLEDWVKVNGELTCPTCSKSCPIPKGGLQKLPPNTILNNLLETMEQISEKDQMKCVCGKEGQVKYYCQDCKQYLCSTCSDHHTNYTLFANHKLHLIEEVQSMSPTQITLLHPPLCSHHSKPLEFYCTDCNIPICVNCIMDHKEWEGKHKPINISDAFQTFKETSATLEKSAQHFINKLERGLKAVIHNATKLQQNKDTCLIDIDNHVEEIFKKEDENGDYFVTEKCTSPGVCKLDVSADDEPINQSPMTIKVEEGRLVNTIKINATYIIDVVKCEDDSLLVSCLTNEMLKYKQSGEYIGKVTLPQGVQVLRMYKMKNGWSNSCVYMFDMNNGKTIKTIGSYGTKEGQMSFVSDVTLTNQGHLLVLESEYLGIGTSRLQLFNNEGRFIKVLVEAGDEDGKVNFPSTVVVDEDDNIIISSQHKLQLFSSDGTFIKRIDKPEDGINNPEGLSIISYHPRRLAVANRGDKT
ncbi:uncharacterized protein LOC117116206, partial [Anneissia japonica]|uniref:uncharacterized protein LOC117116206 n=1 Tax=Anneissia japonica TaxID=1529436 RepID=UPI0014259433